MEKEISQNRKWYFIDLNDQILGRVSTKIADILNGKNETAYAPNLDLGSYVVAINASGIKLSGNKAAEKRYYKHSGFIGNLKTKEYKDVLRDNPEEIIKHSVKGMLPKNRLSDVKLSRLKVYRDVSHPHVNIKFVNR